MKKNLAKVLILVLLIGAFSLSGCSKKEEATETAAANDELINLKISTITTVSWSPLFIADTEGFFEKQGLNVEFVTPGGPKGFQATHAGECEFCMLSQEPLLIAQEQGMRSTILATMLKSRVYGIIASPDITEISQLKGATVYGSDPGSAPYTFSCTVFEKAGLDPMKDLTFMQMDANSAIMALDNGEVKAAFINMSKVPELKGMDVNVLVDTTKEEDSLEYLGTVEFPAEMLCATEEYVKENPEVCQKVVNAILDAQAWIQEHTDAEVAESLSANLTGIDVDVLAEEVATMRTTFSLDGYISEAGEQAVVDMCIKSGLLSGPLAYENLVNMEFVNNYNK